MFVTGLSGISLNFGGVQLTGMVLACVVGMIMGLLFYIFDKLHWTNDREEEEVVEASVASSLEKK